MEIPDAAKIAALFALIAVGFVARHGYRSQFAFEKEEQGIVILWAIFWSVVLNVVFALVGKPVPSGIANAIKSVQLGSVNLVLALNLLWAWLLGSTYGKLIRAWQIVDRDRVQYSIRGWRVVVWVVWKAFFAPKIKLHSALVHDFLANYADRQWAIVEVDNLVAYYGYIGRFDQAPNRFGDYHILLEKPSQADLVSGEDKGVQLCEFMLLKADKINSIRLITRHQDGIVFPDEPTRLNRLARFLISSPAPAPKRKGKDEKRK